MLSGVQIQINALNAIIPDSFIFVMDSTDRSFIYKSQECSNSIEEVMRLDKNEGIEQLANEESPYNLHTSDRYFMIKKIGSHTFLGFVVVKERFSTKRLKDAQDLFLTIA